MSHDPGSPAAAPPADPSLRRNQALAVATAFLSLFSIVGIALYGLPFFYDFFVKDLGWSRQQVTSGNAISKLVVGPLFGFFAGVVVDRFGPKRLMLAGIVMAGLALAGLGSTVTVAAFYSFYFLNALGNVCGGPLPNQVLLSRWFSGARGKAMGVAYLGIGLGGAIVPLAAHALTQAFGWRTALQVLGGAMVAIALPTALLVKEAPAGFRAEALSGSGAKGAGTKAPTGSIGAVLRQPAFYLLAIGSSASIAAVGGTMQNLKLYLAMDRGLSQASVAEVLSLVLVGSLVGRVVMGWLADRWAKKHVMLLIYLIVALSVPLFVLAPGTGSVRTAAFVFGVGLGGDYMIIPLMAAELFGVRLLGRVMGIVITADNVAEATAPMAVAAIRDHAGSYGPGFALLVGLAALGAVSIALLPRRDKAAGASPASPQGH
jgi:sugar phosphate permease